MPFWFWAQGTTSHMDREKLIPWKKQRVILFLAHDEVIEYIKLHLSNCFHFNLLLPSHVTLTLLLSMHKPFKGITDMV